MSLPSAAIVRAPRVSILSRPVFTEPAHLPVSWLGEASDAERLVEYAGRLCFMSQDNPADRTTAEFVENLKKQAHGSVLEHANFSLLIEGVSRSLSHELVRHRAGFAYSQLSQRHVDESDARFVMPPGIGGDAVLEQAWVSQMEMALASYISLVDELMRRHAWVGDKVQRRKLAREGARSVLPNSTETCIVMTGNARAWRAMLELRGAEDADAEMRRLAVHILQLLQQEAPSFFSDFTVYTASDRQEAARVLYHKI
ncbi:MAG: FAD-dependent thymidylate synthase [Gemmatimonas sp.]